VPKVMPPASSAPIQLRFEVSGFRRFAIEIHSVKRHWDELHKTTQTKVLTHRKCYSQPLLLEYDKCKTFHQLTSNSAVFRIVRRPWMGRLAAKTTTRLRA